MAGHKPDLQELADRPLVTACRGRLGAVQRDGNREVFGSALVARLHRRKRSLTMRDRLLAAAVSGRANGPAVPNGSRGRRKFRGIRMIQNRPHKIGGHSRLVVAAHAA